MLTTDGLDAAEVAFAAMFELIPDLTGQVHRWGPRAEGCSIEFTLRGTVAVGLRQRDRSARSIARMTKTGMTVTIKMTRSSAAPRFTRSAYA
jgi:hypothetical protein